MASFVTLHTRTIFQTEKGGEIERRKTGSGVVLDGKYVLTVEHVIAHHKLTISTPFGVIEVPVKKRSPK